MPPYVWLYMYMFQAHKVNTIGLSIPLFSMYSVYKYTHMQNRKQNLYDIFIPFNTQAFPPFGTFIKMFEFTPKREYASRRYESSGIHKLSNVHYAGFGE